MTAIREGCFADAQHWVQPTGSEVRALLKLAGLTGVQTANELGLKDSRTIRRWVSDETPIPWACWAILCEMAGKGLIWK